MTFFILPLCFIANVNAGNGFLNKAFKQAPQDNTRSEEVAPENNLSDTIAETAQTPEVASEVLIETPSPRVEENAAIQLLPAMPPNNPVADDIESNDQIPFDQYVHDPVDSQSIPEVTLVESEEDAGNIWDRVYAGFEMKMLNTKSVKLYERRYSQNAKYFSDILSRGEKYLFHIVTELEKRNMPTELALLPIIESAYNPAAHSDSAADGIWQIIPSTGRSFGLKQNWWKDERRDIKEATDAALNYLEKLHGMFGSWHLALAAYNAGEGTVSRAIKLNKKLGKPTNYDQLRLPEETKQYIPKLQAVKNIVMHPEKFGVTIKPIQDKPYFKAVSAPAQIDTLLVPELAGISDSEFYALNPHFKRPVIASTGKENTLLLPVEAVQTFEDNLSFYNKPLVTWQPYTLKPGEPLAAVAGKFDIQLNELRKANQLPSQLSITKPTTILVPNAEAKSATDSSNTSVLNEPNSVAKTVLLDINKTQNSENLDKTTIEDLKNNHLILKKKSVKSAQTKMRISHIVKRGDTLSEISEKYNVPTNQIIALNNLRSQRIQVGQRLVIKGKAKQKPPTLIKKQ